MTWCCASIFNALCTRHIWSYDIDEQANGRDNWANIGQRSSLLIFSELRGRCSSTVEAAVKLLTDPDAFNFSPRTVVVSTVGPSPASIVAAAARLPCKLAWSVHAADNDLRKLLVPTTAHTVEELRDAFVAGLAMRPNKCVCAPGNTWGKRVREEI
eukprot:6188841-Pleurochrysis_carterae.AAC.2